MTFTFESCSETFYMFHYFMVHFCFNCHERDETIIFNIGPRVPTLADMAILFNSTSRSLSFVCQAQCLQPNKTIIPANYDTHDTTGRLSATAFITILTRPEHDHITLHYNMELVFVFPHSSHYCGGINDGWTELIELSWIKGPLTIEDNLCIGLRYLFILSLFVV